LPPRTESPALFLPRSPSAARLTVQLRRDLKPSSDLPQRCVPLKVRITIRVSVVSSFLGMGMQFPVHPLLGLRGIRGFKEGTISTFARFL
jgi:hypothetical protein